VRRPRPPAGDLILLADPEPGIALGHQGRSLHRVRVGHGTPRRRRSAAKPRAEKKKEKAGIDS